MKKILILALLLIFSSPVFATNWFEFFDKQYIDIETIKLDNDIVSFWVKKYNQNKRDKLPVINKKYLYSVDKWNINCKEEKSKIVAINVYDLKENLIYFNNVVFDWNEIIPNTYAEGYYRLFCLAPYKDNPFLN